MRNFKLETSSGLLHDSWMLHVFLSYVREDFEKVDQLREALVARGIDVWMDKQGIGIGQQWGLSISQAIKSAGFFLACFSAASVTKPQSGMEKELAAEQLAQRTPENFWIIPVKLSPCDLPSGLGWGGFSIRSIQYVSLFPDWNAGVQKLSDVILLNRQQRLKQIYQDEIVKVLKTYSSLAGFHLSPMLPQQLVSESMEALGDARVSDGEEIIALAAIYFIGTSWFSKRLKLDTGIVFTKLGLHFFGRAFKSDSRVSGFVRYEELARSPVRVGKRQHFDVLLKATIYEFFYTVGGVFLF